ncbi:UPF0182 family protein [Leucobacter sp. cx-42]|uniref:UPF0182 family membrane protein n=1 Tax=unclassified Leucobacter TaxID=2621730 RepID=UPI00165D3575|nr:MULTISPECIES: UPF0182 family protein [unclassified Leucobacter]MBC9955217.1 UPF0182 family protein [Leucobacter sp. cx-42]
MADVTDPIVTEPAQTRKFSPLAITVVLVVALVIAFLAVAAVFTEVLWFRQVDYLPVFATQWIAAAVMFVIGFLGMAIPVFLSIDIAYRKRPVYARLTAQLDRYQEAFEPIRRVVKWGLPAVIGLFAATAAASSWQKVMLWMNSSPTGTTDPQFNLDISFYLFALPLWQSVLSFASAVVLISLIAGVATSFLYGGVSISAREFRVSKATRIQAAILIFLFLLILGGSLWLGQYSTLTESTSIGTGAMYAGANAVIPGKQILAGIAAIVAILFLVTAFTGKWRLPVIGTSLFVVSALVVGVGYPWTIQQFRVTPDEKSLESEYIERNIEATRAAYGLDKVKIERYDAETDAEPGALRDDAVATANIRIMDPEKIARTFSQLEQSKQYYKFPESLNVDRYVLDGKVEDTISAVRDIDISGQTGWYNRTLVYTHGYGLVAAYGNQRSSGGEPVFLESGIPSTGRLGEFEPRVYFGMNSPEYSVVGGERKKAIELDYPADSDVESTAEESAKGEPSEKTDDVEKAADAEETKADDSRPNFTTFSGDGGPVLSNVLTKMIYALKFQDVELLLSGDVAEGSQVLYDRNPLERVQKVAPYLTLDESPYASVVDGRIVWIIDGYTTSANYPYSQMNDMNSLIADADTARTSPLPKNLNYIRNSVKATVDAYDGSVTLYAWDETDPILKAWQSIYPDSFTPVSEMSGDLLSHVRYPTDMFKVQREVLSKYHVTDAGAFYSKEDAWRTPNDPVASKTTDGTQEVAQPPYYLTLSAGKDAEPNYSIYSTYVPDATGKNARDILTGYLAANSNAGSKDGVISDDYGTLKLLTLPKGNTIAGPGQMQNNFNTDPKVSTELNLLRQGGTQVVSGNLLTLPVGGGLLYVQPVYIEASSGTQFPLLQKVLVSFGDDIAFEDTLDAALDELFGGNSGVSAGDSNVAGGGTDDSEAGAEDGTDGEQTPTVQTTKEILKQMQQAIDERDAAMKKGDWTAYGKADEKLRAALEAAIAAE